MKKRDFETYQKRFRDFEILPKFSETHVFRRTIRHPLHTAEFWKKYLFYFLKAFWVLNQHDWSIFRII